MAATALPLVAVALLVPVMVYRRIRRNIGRQPLAPWRLKLRAGIVLTIFALLAVPALAHGLGDAAAALLAGTAMGIGIGVLAVRHTRFETVDGAEYYVPHPWIGLALIGLLLGRMGWRLWQMWPALQAGAAPAFAPAALSPLTLGVVSLILAYAATLSLGLLRHIGNRATG